MTMSHKQAARQLLEAEGRTEENFIETYSLDSVVPGLCLECAEVYEYEPDQTEGWCDECQANTVVSGLILLGVI